MLKKILKALFPIVLVNKYYLYYNELRIKTIDKIIFPEELFVQEDFLIQRDISPFEGVFMPVNHLDQRLRLQIDVWQRWTQDEYLFVYEKSCLIEPRCGWALTAENKLIYPSLGFSRATYLRKPALQALQMHDTPVEEYAELISLRDTGEENYYHFYNDVLAKLFFLEEKLHLGPEIPILISTVLYNKPFFQYFLQHPFLRDRTWVVQAKQYVRSQKTYFCKPLTHTAHYYERIRLMASPQDVATTQPERRIFITRSPKRLRFIENRAEIEQLCQEEGFEVIDFDTVPLPEQIRLLANSRYVVGIHGAGLVNMLFRGQRPMGLLEIFPPGEYYPFHYMLMAAQFGYCYNAQLGAPAQQPYSGGFYVNPAELRQRIKSLTSCEVR